MLILATMTLLLSGCGGPGTVQGGSRDELPVSCVVTPDPTSCPGHQVGFFYDYRDDRCKPMSHGGCSGRTPFPTLKACLDYCGGKP
jgi:hypothetical protein